MRRIAICISLLLTGALTPGARGQDHKPAFAELDGVIASELRERGVPGAAVAVVVGEHVVYAKGHGVRNTEAAEGVTPSTLFRLGSTTKMFTAAAVVTLADQGKMALDAPIGRVVTGLDPAIAKLTAHQLLSHSAGLRDFASPIASHDDDALGRNVRAWKDDALFTGPGRIYSYSSPGYWLAGFVAEQVHGKPYADTMDELLFSPLGMKRTTLRPLVAATYEWALGHEIKEKKAAVIRPLSNNVAMWPGGSVFSTAQDLSRFAMALMNGGQLEGKQVLSARVASSLSAPHVRLPGSAEVHYGYGLMTYPMRGVRVVTHGGASRGYGSTIQMVPSHRVAIIVLTNASGETLAKTRVKAMELALPFAADVPAAPRQAPPVGPDELSDYVGTYTHAPQRWDVSIANGGLVLTADGKTQQLTKTGERTFVSDQPGGSPIVFVPGDDGRIAHLFLGLYAARKVPGSR